MKLERALYVEWKKVRSKFMKDISASIMKCERILSLYGLNCSPSRLDLLSTLLFRAKLPHWHLIFCLSKIDLNRKMRCELILQQFL